MGRWMFGGGDGDWDHDWRGWWGKDPPYHVPVFVLTHQPRDPLAMTAARRFISSPAAPARHSRTPGRLPATATPTSPGGYFRKPS
jgi:hypothetical protein